MTSEEEGLVNCGQGHLGSRFLGNFNDENDVGSTFTFGRLLVGVSKEQFPGYIF